MSEQFKAPKTRLAKITVSAKAYGELKSLLKSNIVELPGGATLKEFFARLGERNPEFALEALNEGNEPLPHLRVIVNSANVDSGNGLNTVLSDGDTVRLLPPVSGG